MYDEMLHKLSSKVRIRSLFKDTHIEDMKRILHRCAEVLEEKQHESDEKILLREKKRKSIEEVHKILHEKGLSISDLEDGIDVPPRRRRNIQKYIFEYNTLSGDTIRWHGSTTGRLPKEFQEFLNRTGKKRLDYVVED